MLKNFPFLYLFLLIALAFVLLLLLRYAQRSAMRALRAMLLERGDAAAYLQMLESPRLRLVLRKSTLALLRLDGHLAQQDAAAVESDFSALDAMKLKPAEQLNMLQKRLDFFVRVNDKKAAKEALNRLEAFLKDEPDPSLQAVLADAKLLVRIYIGHDVRCAGQLETLAGKQSGAQRGVTLYRLAKLCHYDGRDDDAREKLQEALPLLAGTGWQELAQAAFAEPSLLEAQ